MIDRNAHGIPWITGASLTEVAREQGRAIARDRAWQLDLERRRGEGRVAELLGPSGVEWDRFARCAGLAETARRAFRQLSAETRAFVTAYADGVNDAFGAGVVAPELDELGAAPGAWQPWTPLVAFWAQHAMFGSFPNQLWQHHVRRTAGEEALGLLRREGPTGGSNAFVLGGQRTASGLPLVAGDPHRVIESPGTYVQVRLTCTSTDDRFDVVGFGFAGVPGIQHFGHAGDVAWGITNAAADTHDLRVEPVEPTPAEQRSVEEIPVAGAAPVPVRIERTEHGPVVAEGAGERLSMRTPPDVLADLGIEAFPALLRARTVADVEAAFARWVDPVNNVVAADRAGRAVHFVAGRVPDRSGAGAGWVDPLPHREVGTDAVAVTANQRASAAYAVLGEDFAPPFRAERIEELLAGRDHTAETAAAVLADDRQNAADQLLELVAGLSDLPGAASRVRRRLLDWDRRMAAASVDAALFSAVREQVVRRVCAAPALAGLRDRSPYGSHFAPWFDLAGRVALVLPTILQAEQPFGLDPADVVRDALVAVAEEPPEGPWGQRHRFHARHGQERFGQPGPATPLGGDTDCVLATGSTPGSTLAVRGPVARYVWDLADRSNSRWVVPLGASGIPGDAHHTDQHDTWAAGGTLPLAWPTGEVSPAAP